MTPSGANPDILKGELFYDRPQEVDVSGNAQAVAPGGVDSVGRVPVTLQVNGNQLTYLTHDSDGAAQTYVVNLVSKVIQSQFGTTEGMKDYNPTGSIVNKVVDSVVLPNGTSYHFLYDSWGDITQITMPSGAVATYEWTTSLLSGSMAARAVSKRTLSHDGKTDVWDFAYDYVPAGPNFGAVTVVFPPDQANSRRKTVYEYDSEQHLARIRYFPTPTATTQLLQYDMTWDWATQHGALALASGGDLMTSLTTTLENGLVSRKIYEYDLYAFPHQLLDCGDMSSGFMTCQLFAVGNSCIQLGANAPCVPFVPQPPTNLPPPSLQPGSHGNVTAVKEYAWGQGAPGPLFRQTLRKYLHDQDQGYFISGPGNPGVTGREIRNLVNRVTNQTIYDGAVECQGTGSLNTDTGVVTAPAACTASKLAETAITYDDGNPAASGYLARATAIARWAGGNSYLTTHFTYDQFGNIITATDALGNPTTYSYADAWTGANTCNVPTGANAYLTSVSNALSQTSTETYYRCTGKLATHTDANQKTVSVTYDWLGRPLYVNQPDGGQTHTTYDDVAVRVTVDQLLSADHTREVITQLDQLGRSIQTRQVDPQGDTYTDTVYDALGQTIATTNPHRATPSTTDGITTFVYDSMGRKTQQTQPDGSTLSWAYSGNTVDSWDEAGAHWQRISDLLGLRRMLELGTSANPINYQTDYGYDTLGNLTSVDQAGDGTTTHVQRQFSYNSLSQLVTSRNPETGTICYGEWGNPLHGGAPACLGGYDANGNLLAKADARNVTIHYGYDALNRLGAKWYTGIDTASTAIAAATPPVQYFYDSSSYHNFPTPNGIGRRVGMSDGSGQTAWAYDVMGRTAAIMRDTNGTAWGPYTYTYNLDGTIDTNNSHKYSYDNAGRAVAMGSISFPSGVWSTM